MKPRRLHKLTIFSISWPSCLSLIGECPQISQILRRFTRQTVSEAASNLWNPSEFVDQFGSRLSFDFDFGFDGVRDEALVVCPVIHLLDFLRGRLLFAGEFQPLP